MRSFLATSAVVAAALLAGCQSQQQMVDEMQTDAAQVAKQRGKFELNCPTATAQVLSKEMVQSAVANPRWAPPERAEYTVGVSGCDKRATYLVVCAEGGTGCIAAGAQNVIQTSSAEPTPPPK
jgi:outer membrane murein-binding lipoprotein Lpp